MNRFTFRDLGAEVLDKVEDLKIHIFRCRGKMCGTFEMSGSVGDDVFEDDDDGDTKQADDLRLLSDLLREFQREKP